MAYATGSYTSQDDLITQLFSFATGLASAWTQDQLDTGANQAALHKDNVYVSMSWDGSDVYLYQALGYTGGNAPGTHPNDSGKTATLANQRQIEGIGDAGGTYHFFSNFGASPHFVYGVLEYTAGIYRHFGFGTLVKSNDYTGGEFLFGHSWVPGATSIDAPADGGHSWLLDAVGSSAFRLATVHMEGFPNQPASGKWGACGSTTSVGNDTAGIARVPLIGGSRGGPEVAAFAFTKIAPLAGMYPGIPIKVRYRNTTLSPERRYILGHMPDLYVVQMGNLDPEDEFTVGAETWKVFPAVRKQFLQNNTEESWNMGALYRKA